MYTLGSVCIAHTGCYTLVPVCAFARCAVCVYVPKKAYSAHYEAVKWQMSNRFWTSWSYLVDTFTSNFLLDAFTLSPSNMIIIVSEIKLQICKHFPRYQQNKSSIKLNPQDKPRLSVSFDTNQFVIVCLINEKTLLLNFHLAKHLSQLHYNIFHKSKPSMEDIFFTSSSIFSSKLCLLMYAPDLPIEK